VLALSILGQPARLEPARWWRSSAVIAALGLTEIQSQTIERLYEVQTIRRGRCIERLMEASNRVGRLIRDGVYDEETLRETQAVLDAAAEHRALTRMLDEEIVTLLTREQRRTLAELRVASSGDRSARVAPLP
jgi:Spy/CpxP family protein refolding chaperone